MAFNATFNNISVYRGSQFYWWRKREYPSNDILLQRPENTCCFFFKIRHSNIKILHDKTEVQQNNGVIVAVIVHVF
jgi:hypothetical protein